MEQMFMLGAHERQCISQRVYICTRTLDVDLRYFSRQHCEPTSRS